MIFKNKQKIIESRLADYRDQVKQCMKEFQHAFRQYITNGDRAELESNLRTGHRSESQADDTRRAIGLAFGRGAIAGFSVIASVLIDIDREQAEVIRDYVAQS